MDRRKQTIPTILVVLGATGDLMAKKIVPALFNLHEKKRLPPKFELVGVSRRDWHDDDLRKHIKTILEVKAPNASRAAVDSFLKLVRYHKIAFDSLEDYKGLNNVLKTIDDSWGMCSNKLFYLSVPPQFYETILENVHKSGLADGCGPNEGWTRVIVEKPFGSDEKTAKALDNKLSRLFKEEQIYRVDHYPAKEMLQNLLIFRFANDLFEKEWNADAVERIDIRLFEKIGVEDRGAFYDKVGALRDMGQNHVLQMLALITMEKPERYDAEAIRKARAELVESLHISTAKEAAENSFRAQYEGYRSIKGVEPNADTETYFRLEGTFDNPRWVGVPVVMESGKRLGESRKEIEITLRHEEPSLSLAAKRAKNRIIIHLEPQEGISITFYSKKPGYDLEIEERKFNFDFREKSGTKTQYTEEYEKLLLDCIEGDQTLFISSEEIQAMWRFVDPYLEAWKKNLVPLRHYAPDSPAISAEAAVHMETAKRRKFISDKEIGVFGLGKMGANIARALHDKEWRVVVANRSVEPLQAMEKEGFEAAHDHRELVAKLKKPRIIWMMITAGKGIDEFLFGADGIVKHLNKGDIVIDAGNSFFEDTMRRAKVLEKKGIRFVDIGFSGGPRGARHGGSLMIGGNERAVEYLNPLFEDLSVPGGYAYFGKAGAGHFIKMVHNGIEYGMMQSIAEGFALMKKSPFKLDLQKVARVYNHGSVIESRLIGWMEDAFRVFGEDLSKVSGSVAATGEGEWTIKTGRKWGMKLPAIEDAFKFRKQSQKKPSYMGRILSALRNRFGGHSTGNTKKG
jgi:glucose-6-phosphate 1-dehydrogenase